MESQYMDYDLSRGDLNALLSAEFPVLCGRDRHSHHRDHLEHGEGQRGPDASKMRLANSKFLAARRGK
jgi:hypothetical protein